MIRYYPEGALLDTPRNRQAVQTAAGLADAAADGRVLEARAVLCDAEHNLYVDMPCMKGLIRREEGAIGIAEGLTRDIALISRVAKPVCFTVQGFETGPDGERRAVLSRREAQERCRADYLRQLRPGDIIPARVTRLEGFGAFCDVGCGVAALLPIAAMSVSRIAHPADRLAPGEEIMAVVSSADGDRLCLSQRELLGTWEENAALFSQGETVEGVIRSVEEYGVFVELTPNLAGLAEPKENVHTGQGVSVFIKSILPDKMKIKLIIIETQTSLPPRQPLRYFIRGGHMDEWRYSPPDSVKCIETLF